MKKNVKYEAYTKEIKNRFRYLITSFICCLVFSYYKSTQLIYLFVSSCYSDTSFDSKISFIFTDVREAFSATLLICFVFSLFTFSTFLTYSSVCFFLPSWFVYERARKLLLVLSILFSCIYYILWLHLCIIPLVCNFFFTFQVRNIDCFSLTVEPRIYSYVVWEMWLLFLAIFFFVLVCSLLFLIVRNKITLSHWSSNRKARVFGTVLVAALISPPELLTQLLLSFTLFFLLELIVLFAFLLHTFVNKRSIKNSIVYF